MSTQTQKHRTTLRVFAERLASLIAGEPTRLVSSREIERLERLAYRHKVYQAEASGDSEWIEAEINRNQLTSSDRDRLAAAHTDLHDWPDCDADAFAPGALESKAGEADNR